MPKLFHLNCSPRADSESAAGAQVFLEGFRNARPDWDIDVMNLWRDHLPEFEGYVLEAKYARMAGRAFTDSQRDAFAVAERIAMRFSLADRVLISTPMWNFSIPYKLKQWFDVIVQPGLTFRFDPAQGYLPLLKDRPTIVISARGAPLAREAPALQRRRRRALRADRPNSGTGRADQVRARDRAPPPGRT